MQSVSAAPFVPHGVRPVTLLAASDSFFALSTDDGVDTVALRRWVQLSKALGRSVGPPPTPTVAGDSARIASALPRGRGISSPTPWQGGDYLRQRQRRRNYQFFEQREGVWKPSHVSLSLCSWVGVTRYKLNSCLIYQTTLSRLRKKRRDVE